jgi:hypothetical protein
MSHEALSPFLAALAMSAADDLLYRCGCSGDTLFNGAFCLSAME